MAMIKTKRTKRLQLTGLLLTLLSICLTFGPLIVYTVLAFNNNNASTSDKITLMSMLSVGTILSLVCIVTKYTPRCRHWLILIGLYLCLDKFIGCVLVMAITQAVDELLVHPLAKHYRNIARINKEMDKRITSS